MNVCMDVGGSRRSRFIVAALAALHLLPAAPVAAQESTPSVSMGIEAGIGGYIDPSAPLAVRVDLSSRQLLVGRVEVRANRRTSSVDVEVPAGSTKRYVVEVPALGRSRQVTVAVFRDADESILSENVRVRVPGDEVIVAVSGIEGIDTNLRSARSTPIGREITTVRVDLDAAANRMSVAPYLVVGPGALSSLDAATTQDVESWVRRGGRVIGPPAEVAVFGAPLGDVLPGTSAAASVLGAGEVLAVGDPAALDAAGWSAIIRDVAPKGLVFDQSQEAFGATLLSAASAGREAAVPALPWLLLGILLFVVLVGPVNFLVLRWMGRPEWAWLTVPLLSAVFVAGFWFIGRSQLNDFTVDQATVLIDEYGDVQASTALVLQAATEGTHELALPEGWSPEPFESLGLLTATDTTVEDGRTVLSFEMKDLGVGVAQASLDPDRPDVTVAFGTSQENLLDATVTNNSEAEFWAWGIVMNGRANRGDGALAAGGAAEIQLRPRGGFTQYEAVISTGVVRSLSSPTRDQNTYLAVEALARHAETMTGGIRDGGAYFYGFTDELQPRLTVDGRTSPATGTTLVVTQIDLDPDIYVGIGRVRPELLSVAGASSLESWYGEIYAYGADSIVLGYRVPEGVPNLAKIGTTSRQFEIVEAYDWELEEYVAIEWNENLSLPRFTSVTGDIVVRASVDPERDSRFMGDESIVLDRYALVWSTP